VDFGKQLAEESRFSRAAGSRDNHRGEMSSRLSDHIIQISRYVWHASTLRLNFRIINNKAGSPVAQWRSIRLLTFYHLPAVSFWSEPSKNPYFADCLPYAATFAAVPGAGYRTVARGHPRACWLTRSSISRD
jgi:hypothetical protein